jgi:hypothetical protein
VSDADDRAQELASRGLAPALRLPRGLHATGGARARAVPPPDAVRRRRRPGLRGDPRARRPGRHVPERTPASPSSRTSSTSAGTRRSSSSAGASLHRRRARRVARARLRVRLPGRGGRRAGPAVGAARRLGPGPSIPCSSARCASGSRATGRSSACAAPTASRRQTSARYSAAVCSAISSHENSDTARRRPASPKRRARSSSRSTVFTRSAMSAANWSGSFGPPSNGTR